jgi:hypothetical protein
MRQVGSRYARRFGEQSGRLGGRQYH